MLVLELNVRLLTGTFPSNTGTNRSNKLPGSPPPQTFCDVHNHKDDHGAISQAFRCFRYSSVICLALYKDMPVPNVAIVMAMGSVPLLWGCICTSPETCLCGQSGFKASYITYIIRYKADYINHKWIIYSLVAHISPFKGKMPVKSYDLIWFSMLFHANIPSLNIVKDYEAPGANESILASVSPIWWSSLLAGLFQLSKELVRGKRNRQSSDNWPTCSSF